MRFLCYLGIEILVRVLLYCSSEAKIFELLCRTWIGNASRGCVEFKPVIRSSNEGKGCVS
jgi:hypothetical protein